MDHVMGKIEKLIDEYPTNLGYILNNNDSVYNKLYDGNKNIQVQSIYLLKSYIT